MNTWPNTTVLATALGLLVGRAGPATNSCCPVAFPGCCAKSPAPAQYTEKSLYQVESTWTTDEGKQIKLGALRGRPQVIAMFFASCQFTCPITIHDLKQIAAALPENVRTNVGFTLVSFDSDRDTPEVLHAVRKDRELTVGNWTLLRGEPEDVRELAALLGVNYRKDSAGQFTHANVITVLNSAGEIVLQQPGLNLPPDKVIASLQRISAK